MRWCPVTLSSESATRFAQIADNFTNVAKQVNDWNAPTPVPDWVAQDVVFHLVDWIPGLLNSASTADLPTREASADPSGAWQTFAEAMKDLLADPTTSDRAFEHPQAGSMPLLQAINMLCTPDVFMHTWDLAESAGVDANLDREFAQQMLDGMTPIEDMLRASGQYGPAVPVPDDADVVVRLMAFVGHDPDWRRDR